jgi:hypothetical protein
MQLQLSDSQNADRERLGACVVVGQLCGYHADGRPKPPIDAACACYQFPPRQFADAAAPCPCGKLTGKPGWTLAPGFKQMKPCPDCRDGKPIIEIRVPCPNNCTRFDGKVPGHIYGSNWPWVPCQTCMGTMFVVVARATVTLLPVLDATDTNDHVNVRHVCIAQGSDPAPQAFLDGGSAGMRRLAFDPLPVAGRDWIAVFEDVA